MDSHGVRKAGRTQGTPACPMCRAPMVERDRVQEDGSVYIWYACSRAACGGQWLTQSAPPRGIQARFAEAYG